MTLLTAFPASFLTAFPATLLTTFLPSLLASFLQELLGIRHDLTSLLSTMAPERFTERLHHLALLGRHHVPDEHPHIVHPARHRQRRRQPRRLLQRLPQMTVECRHPSRPW